MQFLDLKPEETLGEDAKVVIIPIPYEATTSYGKGTAKGPEAIIQASSQIELFVEDLESEPYRCGIFTERPIEFGEAIGEGAIKIIESATLKIVEKGKFPLALGGEHTITTGLVKAVYKKYPDLHVVHLDAHADMRLDHDGNKWSHACVMRRINELGIPYTSIGIRALSKGEFDLIRPRRKNYFFAHEIAKNPNWIQDALKTISGPVYLTLDVDVFDAGIIPHTGTPMPGGLNWYQVTDFLRTLMENKNVVAADVVELAPNKESRASDVTIANLVYKSVGYWHEKHK